jgi:hypothetical protein
MCCHRHEPRYRAGLKASVVGPLDSCKPMHQRDCIMEASGLIDELLDIHRNLDAFRYAPARTQASAARASRVASSSLLQISLRQILMASFITAVLMASSLVNGDSTAPNGAAVEWICEQSYGSLKADRLRDAPGKPPDCRVLAQASAGRLTWRFNGLFG